MNISAGKNDLKATINAWLLVLYDLHFSFLSRINF